MSHCHSPSHSSNPWAGFYRDWLFLISGGTIVLMIAFQMYAPETWRGTAQLDLFATAIFELLIQMAPGLVIATLMVGVMDLIPRDLVMGLLGTKKGWKGLVRASVAGFLLDLCNHGILLIGMKFYERGVSLGQVIAFLLSSPWNSLSLTIVLISLIGFPWTLSFILLSALVAIISGALFELLVRRGTLNSNPNSTPPAKNFKFWSELRAWLVSLRPSFKGTLNVIQTGLVEGRVILRWIFFGIVIAAAVRALVDPSSFQTYFGANIVGLALTLVVATVMEVCSEGSAPIAAEILNRAQAPGNAFLFLMTGVSTDYTEIVAIKETTRSWKTALFLPLITVPQVFVIALILNWKG